MVALSGLAGAKTADVFFVLVDLDFDGFEVAGHLLNGFHIFRRVYRGVAREFGRSVGIGLCNPCAADTHIDLRRQGVAYQRPPAFMRIGVCLAELYGRLEKTLVWSFHIGRVEPTFHFQVVADSGRAADGSFAAYADIASYRNITVYLFCWD